MSSSTHIGTVYGIPIKVHITLWIVLPIIAFSLMPGAGFLGLAWGLLFATGLFTSVALHELGHSFVSVNKGCPVREILLLPIGGMAKLDRLPSKPRDELQIAIAGPAVSIALSIFCAFMAVPFERAGMFFTSKLLASLGMMNLYLALFNLLPSYPMDGGRVFRALLEPRYGRLEATRRAVKLGRIMALGFGVYGLFTGNFSLVIIAIFIYLAAGAEYRVIAMQEKMKTQGFNTPFSAPPPRQEIWSDDREFVVSPPPYARKKKEPEPPPPGHGPSSKKGGLFDDLFRNWH
ncbi:MAG: hypothetical protein EOM20_13810 [Spartobacteria bacterium]|nr:hypothetical protein [Spartobacteria bacterium]